MNAIWEAVASNAILAAVAAVAAAIATRLLRRPAVAYWLWLLVLIKLVTPPVLHAPLLWPAEDAAGLASVAPSRIGMPNQGAHRLALLRKIDLA